MKDAPGIEPGGELSPDEEAQLYAHYGEREPLNDVEASRETSDTAAKEEV